MPAKISQRPGKGFSGLVLPDEMSDIFFITLQEQPLTHASLRYPTFATSLTGYVTSEIAEDDWELDFYRSILCYRHSK